MVFDFLTLTTILVFISLLLEFIHIKFLKGCHGIDLLFFAPWIFAIKFGFSNALTLGLILMVIHIVFNLHMARFVAFALPAVLLAVIFGNALGVAGFYTALIVYMIASIFTTSFFGGFGPRFVLFLVFGTLFNIGLFSVYQNFVTF
ncbi:MAG: hypothetical protein HY361_00495 [Candidatus Aenigmarchaeota archaeon]|nr:hypothetical protein [Candidatus Aenigmarchaeota archaeon]